MESQLCCCCGGSTAPAPSPGYAQLTAPHSPQGLHEVEVSEFMQLHKGMQDLDVELIPVGKKPEHEGCMISNPVTAEGSTVPALLQSLLTHGGTPHIPPVWCAQITHLQEPAMN